MQLNILDKLALLPFATLVAFTLCMLLVDLVQGKKSQSLFWPLAGCGFTAAAFLLQFYHRGFAFSGLVHVDGFSAVLGMMILLGAAFTFLLNYRQLDAQRAYGGLDVDLLILLSTCGGMVMVTAANLMVFFVGFELLSICVYVLSGIARKERASAEGSLKYFILGSFSSAFLLYGITLIYGATGTMDIATIASRVNPENLLVLVGLGFMLFGFAFKISLVPFHVWAPDVYQGAPVSIAAFMAVVVKIAAFGSFLRVMLVGFPALGPVWSGMIWLLALLSMTIGNLMALKQRSIKRMLAYSSISHAGYALMGFLALQGEAVLFYLLVYSFMTIAAFGVVLLVTGGSSAQYGSDDMESFSGIGWSHPGLGVVMTIALLSLAGIPPLSGFVGKFYLFSSAVSAGYKGLAIIAALNSVISLYYYLGVIIVMYFSPRKLSWLPSEKIHFAPGLAVTLATLAVVYLGFYSEPYMQWLKIAVSSL